jgi:hypothetical protein
MKRRTFLIILGVLLTASSGMPVVWADDTSRATGVTKPTEHLRKPFANPQEDLSLPNVLLIGDSISIGYTVPVRKLLGGKANVFRPPINCQYSSYGVANVKSWLGTRHWDVIHFNWGIWDTHYLHNGQLVRTTGEGQHAPGELKIRATETQYLHNLKQILTILKKTDAKLVWASTTPVMSRTGERFEHIAQYNRAAAKLMSEQDIEIDDLYSFVLPHTAKWQTTDKVHYNQLGNAELGKKVAACIEQALSNKTGAESETRLVRPGFELVGQ